MQSLISEADDISHSRKATVTVNVLEEYKDIITNTTSDLEKHLQEIDNKLQPFSLQGTRTSDEDRAERAQLREEMDSTEQCLRICAQTATDEWRVGWYGPFPTRGQGGELLRKLSHSF
jgi:hypothetical protein